MENKKHVKKLPDYSGSRQRFRLSGYYAPTDGTWYDRGEKHSVEEDFRTVERYREYLDAGLNLLLLSGSESCKYRGEDWQTCDAKMMMDRAYEAGITEILLFDYRLREEMSAVEGGLIGIGKMFPDEASLDKYVEECMRPYRRHPAFAGVILRDEPKYTMLESVGQVYRSIKRVCPGAHVHCNLWPPAYSSIGTFLPTAGEPKDIEKSWRAYLTTFVEATGADYVQYDQYPLQPGLIAQGYLKGLQMTAEFCKERDLTFRYTSQAFGMVMNGAVHHRPIKEADAYWLMNAMLGFGVKEIAYYSYWTFQNCFSETVYCLDGTSFVTWDGRKTEVYYFMQKVNRDLQKFAPVILNFDYQASTYFTKPDARCYNGHVADHEFYEMKRNPLKYVESVEFDRETILLTELKDRKDGFYMYMVQNIVDPAETDGAATRIAVRLAFDRRFGHAIVYDRGVPQHMDLAESAYSCVLDPGQAKFILLYA